MLVSHELLIAKVRICFFKEEKMKRLVLFLLLLVSTACEPTAPSVAVAPTPTPTPTDTPALKVIVRTVVMMSPDAAVALLREANLRPEKVEERAEVCVNNVILRQEPFGGTEVEAGSTVKIYTCAGPTPTSPPAAPPTRTRTSTPIPTPTIPKLILPSGVTFKFDNGVPAAEREIIQTVMALARDVFGDAGTFTVYAYADENALLDQVARNLNVSRNDPQIAPAFYREYQQQFDQGGLVTGRGIIYLSATNLWGSRSFQNKLSSLTFAYFDQVRSNLAGTYAFTSPWFDYGILTWAQNVVMFKYGYADQEQFRREAIQRSRGVLNSLTAMADEKKADSEDPSEKRILGYLALDYLAANYGGEQAVFRKFWENFPKYPGWQLAFKATFGLTLDEFYPKFEEYRRIKFPPDCGAAGSFSPPALNAPLTLRFIRQDPPGAITFSSFPDTSVAPAPVAYTFCASGYPLPSLQNMNTAIKLPTASLDWYPCGGNCIIVYMPQSATPGSYTFAIELPDKRRTEVQFQHSIPPAATPKP